MSRPYRLRDRRRARRFFSALLVCALASAALATAQRNNPDTRAISITGRIVAAGSSTPLRRVRVTVLADQGESSPVLTDEQGRFRLVVPSTAPYTIRARKTGFAPVDLPPSVAKASPVELVMAKGAAIQGRVVDQDGNAVEFADVHVREVRTDDGVAAFGAATVTDDRGDFRIGSLPAGRYEVHVSDHAPLSRDPPPPNPPRRSVATAVLTVQAGEERVLSLRHDFGTPFSSGGANCFVAQCPAGSGTIRGVITSAEGRPLAGASVVASAYGGMIEGYVGSDSHGRFEIRLPTGTRYGVRVSRLGYVEAVYRGRAVVLADGEVRGDIDVSLTRGSALEGRVEDGFGGPVEGLSVILLRAPLAAPGRLQSVRTDDRGRYRLHGIVPGAYYIVAVDEPAYDSPRWTPARPHMYYPRAATIADATRVNVTQGSDLSGIDVRFSPPKGVTVRGRSLDADGQPVDEGRVILRVRRRPGENGPPSPRYEAPTGRDGTFVVSNVLPGTYMVHDSTGDSDGLVRVTVGATDVGPLVVKPPRPATLTGVVVFEGDASGRQFWHGVAAWPSDPNLGVVDADDLAAPWQLKPDGTFELTGRAGAYRVTTQHIGWLPGGWWLKSATIGAVDVTDSPFTFKPGNTYSGARLVFSQTAGEVSGRVLQGNIAAGRGSVVVFPTDRRKWYDGSRFVRSTSIVESGLFRVSGVPPGEYFVAAVADALATEKWSRFLGGAPPDRDVLERLRGSARRVLLAERGQVSMDLPLTAALAR